MIVVKNPNYYVNGNTVLKPDFDDFKEEHSRKKRIQDQKVRDKKLKFKLSLVRNIAISFIIGLLIIFRYGLIYNMQGNINTLNTNIKSVVAENDSLTIKLATKSNLKTLEDVTTSKLGMVKENSSQVIYSDLNKNNFSISNMIITGKNSKGTLIDKIMRLLF